MGLIDYNRVALTIAMILDQGTTLCLLELPHPRLLFYWLSKMGQLQIDRKAGFFYKLIYDDTTGNYIVDFIYRLGFI